MGILKLQSKLSAIGMEFDAHEFRAVQLMQTSKGISTLAWAVFPRRDEGDKSQRTSLPEVDELQWAASILGRRGFVGTTVSIAPSTADCSSHVIELPPAESGAPIDQLARMEVARARRCGPNDFELGHWSLPAKGRTAETLAVACPRSIIDSTILRYNEAGLQPGGIDLMELAICRGGESHSIDVDDEINASLHVGWTSSLAVLTLGNTVMYVRRIERGTSSVWDVARGRYRLSRRCADELISDRDIEDGDEPFTKLQRSVWAGLAAELASELDVAIAYVSNSYRFAPFGKIKLSGYGAYNPAIADQLDKVLGIPITSTPPSSLLEAIGSEKNAWSMACRLCVPYGLAARFDQ